MVMLYNIPALAVLPDFIPKASLGFCSSSIDSFCSIGWDMSGDRLASLTGLKVGLTFGADCT